MNRIHIALFPALLLGISVLVIFASLANTSEEVQASAPQAAATTRNILTTSEPVKATVQVPSGNCSVSTRYPASIRQWCSQIEAHAKKSGMDANLIAAVMLQESGGNPKAYSTSGAVGLMQVMPRDGLATKFLCSGKPCFSTRPSMAELYDPDFNISYGVRMLAGLVQKTGSNRKALHAYGPMDVGYYYADKVLRIYENYK
ncbi:MAG: transglycosylase SLT domain-containing protein [Saprospiraceae bacterium]|nr:transglycosylase SLT domain-containing protein [Saprospiraceae bacterium]